MAITILKEDEDELVPSNDISREDFDDMRSELEQAKESLGDVKKRDVKSIELISIFVALITFATPTITLFRFTETLYSAVMFACLLGMIAISVIATIHFTFNKDHFKKEHALILSPVALILVVMLITHAVMREELKEIVINNYTERYVQDEIDRLEDDNGDLRKEIEELGEKFKQLSK